MATTEYLSDINPNEWIILESDTEAEVQANINLIMANLDYLFAAYLKRTNIDPQEVELVVETKVDKNENGRDVHQMRYYFQRRIIVKSSEISFTNKRLGYKTIR